MAEEYEIPQPGSRFLKVKCLDYGNEQEIFGICSTKVTYLICNKVLAVPTGGKAKVQTKILAVLG
ncbi:MAG: 30S ribosomal protein S27e [Promethearchaeota archaeon]